MLVETIKLKTHIGSDGLLKLQMPVADVDAEVLVIYTVADKPEQEREPWADFVNRMYGALADDPIERPDDLALDIRDEIE